VHPTGEALLDLVATARHEVLLVAPFIKRPTLNRVLRAIAPGVPVLCVTRWEPREIAAGVSDLEIWDVLAARQGTELRLRVGLHAKLYRADGQCLVGSANLTDAALGWSGRPNLELLVPGQADDPEIEQFERELMASSVVADHDVYESVKRAADALRASALQMLGPEVLAEAAPTGGGTDVGLSGWLPSCRSPDRLFEAYCGRDDRMLTSAFTDAQRDLAALGVPTGLNRAAFHAYVVAVLEQLPVVRDLDAFAEVPRERDEMSGHLAERMGADIVGASATEAWDTLKLWLLAFFPERYRIKPPAGTEVFVRGRRLA